MGATYTERRKADRAHMASKVVDLARSLDATAERDDAAPAGDHWIEIESQGLQVSIQFESKSCQPDVYVIAWHTRGTVRLHADRWPGVNTVHFGKCTRFAYGFEDLCAQLEHGLQLARSGEAFQ